VCTPPKFAIRLGNRPIKVVSYGDRLGSGYEDWLRVLWTDKSTFSTTGFRNHPWVMRKVSEEYYADCVDETFESGHTSLMIWGGFCDTLKSRLVFIPCKAKVDSASVLYVSTIMYPHLVAFWHQCCETYGWTAMVEDGAPGYY